MRKLLMAAVLATVTGTAACAADMPVKAGFDPAPLAGWTGLYGGVNAGAAWGYFRAHNSLPGPTDVGGNATFGGQVGYNAQAGRLVLGVEADASWIDIHARSTGARFDEDWMATLRLRLGYALEKYLLYLTAGVGFTHVKTAVTGLGNDSSLQVGFAGGFGIEKRFSPAWSGRAEALFVDVPTRSYNNGTFVTGGGSHNYVLRAAVNYHWQ
jgi:outer membrane immunogenic protein